MSVCNDTIAPICKSERGIYAASTPDQTVTSKNTSRIALATVKRHKCRAPAALQLHRSSVAGCYATLLRPGTGALRRVLQVALRCSADWQSAVSPTRSRQLLTSRLALQVANLRYSRLPVCATVLLSATLAFAADTPTTNASPVRTSDQVEFRIGPVYANAPELREKSGVPKGTIHEFVMNSEDSKIYPGVAKNTPGTVPYKRKVAVYVPQQYVAGTPAPFIVVQDGIGYLGTLPKILDNLIHEKRVPAMVAIMINSGGGDAQGSERGLEYDTVSERYTTFIETEVLPRISKEYGLKFTKDPEGRATMGGSSGAACAFTMAWFRPDLYRKVLSYSGTFVNQQSPRNPDSPHGAWEYHENLIPKSERKPIRIWLEVSENDNGSKRDEASLHNWVMANERMAAVLKKKGYAYRYVFAEAAGHTDGRVTRQTLPGALEWLWEGYLAPDASKTGY